MARVLAALSLVALAAASSSNPAICENKLSAFFVIDNRVLDSEESTRFKDFSEEECQHACSTNRDPDGRSLLCASFTYDHKTFECVLYKDKTIPAGEVSLTADVGKRYFEKFCLAEDLPRRCGESQFIRADGHVLVGFAKNVTLTETLEECVAACVREPDCQSSMYFYEEGECIMNTESAITKPDAFQDEDTDKVVYFQNGCRRSRKRVKSHKRTTTTTTTTEAPETTTEDEVLEEPVPEEEEEITSTPEGTAEVESASGTEEVFEDETSTPPLSNEEEVVESSGEELLGEDQQEEEEEEDDGEEQLVDVTEEFEETNQIPKKYTKHPKNFGAKTVKEANQVADEEAEADQAEVEGELAELEQGDGSQKKHDLSIKPLKNKTQYQQSFFSEWSDWTECGPEGGRTVRRRKCLDLRKCIGALTQVTPCPPVPAEVVPAAGGQPPAEGGPIGPSSSVKSVVPEPTDRDEFALGAASSIAPPAIEGPQAPATEPEKPGAWSPWLGTCQQFASGQPCSNHEMIGFESRECIAADPSQCEGPFFRYCTLPC